MPSRAFLQSEPNLPRTEETGFAIPAEAHTDDLRICVAFDAAGAFEFMDSDTLYKWLKDLNSIGWSADYAADDVAHTLENHPDYTPVNELFSYLARANPHPANENMIGFEVTLDEIAAIRWIREHDSEAYFLVASDLDFADLVSDVIGEDDAPAL